MKLDTTLPYLLCFSVISFFFLYLVFPQEQVFHVLFNLARVMLMSSVVLCCVVL